MKTLVVVPGGGLFLQLNGLAKDRYPGAMVVSYGTGLAGRRFDKIVAILKWREDAATRRFIEDWVEQYLPTKMPPGGKVETIELDEFMSMCKPYIEHTEIVVVRKYNPSYGDDRMCQCGHPYYRHFDTYENMADAGCKYCDCSTFVEVKNESP